MDRLSDRGSIPLRSIFEKTLKSLISGVFCYLVERKNAVLNRFKTGSEWKNWGQNWGQNRSGNHLKIYGLECFGVLQIKKMII